MTISAAPPQARTYPAIPISSMVVTSLAIGLTVAARVVGDHHWIDQPLHSAIEAVGATIALGVAVLLILRWEQERRREFLVVASCLVIQGILDLVHSMAPVGAAFFWSRALPTLLGGAGMSAVWFIHGPSTHTPSRLIRVPLLAGVASFLFAIGLLALPQIWPPMFTDGGDYLAAAKVVNLIGGVGYLSAKVFFVRQYQHSRRADDLVFAHNALLFGLAGVMFMWSEVWSPVWWLFHLFRLAAYVVVLRFVVDVYRSVEASRRSDIERALIAASERLRLHVENSPLAAVEWDDEFRVTRWSAGAERMFGWSADDAVGRTAAELGVISEAALMVMADTRPGPASRRAIPAVPARTKDAKMLETDWYTSAVTTSGAHETTLALILDVTARAAAERDLLKAKEDADRANKAKDDFLAVLSHELRTPLTALVGWISMLQGGYLPQEDLPRAIREIARSARQQQRMVEDLLDLSRIARGTLELETRAVDVGEIVADVVAALQPVAAEKELSLEMHRPKERLVVMGDKPRLEQVFTNVIGNAIKFTNKGGSVTATVCRSDNRATVVVRDTGIGIGPEFLPFVFDRFRQADGSTTRAHGGLGLGLSIVRELVTAHGGHVAAESAGTGKGATFTIVLPLIAVGAGAQSERYASV